MTREAFASLVNMLKYALDTRWRQNALKVTRQRQTALRDTRRRQTTLRGTRRYETALRDTRWRQRVLRGTKRCQMALRGTYKTASDDSENTRQRQMSLKVTGGVRQF